MEYYININNEKRGPYNIQELGQRGINATTLVMEVNSDKWVPAWQIEELRDLLSKDSVKPVIGEPIEDLTNNNTAQYVTAEPVYNNQQMPTKKDKRGWLISIIIIAFIIIAAILIISCPTESDHKEAMEETAMININDSSENYNNLNLSTNNNLSDNFKANISDFIKKYMDDYFSQSLHVDNYLFFSVGKIRVFHDKKIAVSFGILGHVYTINKTLLNNFFTEFINSINTKKIEQFLEPNIKEKIKKDIPESANDIIKSITGKNAEDLLNDIEDNIPSTDSIDAY